jgi:hypothetical protein
MSAPYILPTGSLNGYTVQLYNDVSDFPPHTFIVVTGPDGIPHGYGFAPSTPNSPLAPGQVFDNTGHSWDATSGPISLTGAEYSNLAAFINNSIAYPPYYNVAQGQECSAWAIEAPCSSI